MNSTWIRIATWGCVSVTVAGLALYSDDGREIRARLNGFQEVPPISSAGTGEFRAELNEAGTQISYTLAYAGLQGAPTMAHIHFGPRSGNAGIIAFLCGGGGKPACPASGPVSGTIIAADVLGPAEQGIGLAEFNEVVHAIRRGIVYANVHTSLFPNGEIRGQVKLVGRDDDDDDDRGKGKGENDD